MPSLNDDLKQQEISQAVIVADNFNRKFSPLTNSTPLFLLPIVNGTFMDYLLQSLEDAGIQETFIFCCSHNNLIRNYINSSHWSNKDSPMSVTVISDTSFLSMGDIMRALDAKALIRSDFILINGAIITTFPLNDILEEHRKCRQIDKNSAITLLYRKASPKHKTKCKEHLFLIAVDSKSNKIRYYQRINKAKMAHIPLEVFQENDEVTVHYNLLDSSLSICSPCVPPLFSDNFDYQTMDDFVKGLLINEELLGNSMYIRIAESGYGANISNMYMYDVVSQDIISRWTHPIVPDLTDLHGCAFSHYEHNIYKQSGVEVGRNCQLKQNVVLGKGTTIGDNTFIENSVIGRNCEIGENVTIKGSYLFNDVTVLDGCTLSMCLLGDKVKLKKNVQINDGCVLGSEVMIDESIVLPPLMKLQAEVFVDEDSFGEDDFDDDLKSDQNKTCDFSVVGDKGHGYVCKVFGESDEEEDGEIEDVWGKAINDTFEDNYEESESSSSEILSPGEGVSDESEGEGYDDETNQFYNEVLESLQRGIEEKVNSENTILEINASKHAYNITIKEVNTLLIKALLKLPLENAEICTPQLYLSNVKPFLQFFHPLVLKYIKSTESQLDCLSAIEEFMKNNEKVAPALIKVIHFWYDKELLKESVIIKWFKDLSPESDKIKKLAATFIDWLQTADEESSEEELSSEE